MLRSIKVASIELLLGCSSDNFIFLANGCPKSIRVAWLTRKKTVLQLTLYAISINTLDILANYMICLDTILILRFCVPKIRQPKALARLVGKTFALAPISTIASQIVLLLGPATMISNLGVLTI